MAYWKKVKDTKFYTYFVGKDNEGIRVDKLTMSQVPYDRRWRVIVGKDRGNGVIEAYRIVYETQSKKYAMRQAVRIMKRIQEGYSIYRQE